MARTRNTDRKRFIRDALNNAADIPIVLEELRWAVMRREWREQCPPCDELTLSEQKSFNRSLRSFLPEVAPGFTIHKVTRADGWTTGLLARIAIFRLARVSLLERFLTCKTPSVHFWSNSRTADVWEEGGDGEIEVRNPDLLPPGAPNKLPSLYPGRSYWPRSTPERQRGLKRLGPKYLKKPLVCVKLCLCDTPTPNKSDTFAVFRIPINLPLTVVGHLVLDMSKLGPPVGRMYRRWKGVTSEVGPQHRLV